MYDLIYRMVVMSLWLFLYDHKTAKTTSCQTRSKASLKFMKQNDVAFPVSSCPEASLQADRLSIFCIVLHSFRNDPVHPADTSNRVQFISNEYITCFPLSKFLGGPNSRAHEKISWGWGHSVW